MDKFPIYSKARMRRGIFNAWRRVHENGITSKSEETRKDVVLFSEDADTHINRIVRQLKEERFKFPPARGIAIKRVGKRSRPIVSSPIPSRIVQRRILDVLQDMPAIQRYYKVSTSFGGIKSRGVRDALDAAYKDVMGGATHYIRSDIQEFFTKIPRGVVISKIEDVVDDKKFIDLLTQATTTELENLAALGEDADRFPIYDIGVAQGCCLSPLLGNILLSDFDAKMNGRGILCLRYIDDFIILGKSPSSVAKAFKSAQHLLGQYGLTAYDPADASDKAKMGPIKNGFEFLGCEIRPGIIRPNKKARNRLLESIDMVFKKSVDLMSNPMRIYDEKRSVIQTLNEANNVIKGWGNQYSFCNDIQSMNQLDEQIDERISGYLARYGKARNKLSGIKQKDNRRRLIGVHLLTDSKHDPIIKPKDK